MFKKLLSNLPYNPSLINQVAFYAKRMHAEEKIRRLGLAFVVLAMLMQTFAVLDQPEQSLALSQNDIVPGGFSTQSQAAKHCRENNYNFKTILKNFDVSCEDVATATTKNIRSTAHNRKLLSLGRDPYGKAGERSVRIDGKKYYQRYLWSWDSGPYSTYKALSGKNSKGKQFYILYNCGNITVVEEPTPPPPPPPVPGNAECKDLSSSKLNASTYKFTASTKGTKYSVKSYSFNFGDGTSDIMLSDKRTESVRHSYKKNGMYTAKVSIAVNFEGRTGKVAKTVRCQTKLTVKLPAKPTTPTPPEPEEPTPPPAEPTPEEPTPPVDACPNLPGNQEDSDDCDVCPDVNGTQSDEAECKPCEGAEDDQDVTACLILSKTAKNETQDLENADGTVAQAGDIITYTLSVQNTGNTTIKDFVVEEHVSDVLDYATITDYHGGTKYDGNIVRWPRTDVRAGRTIEKKLTIKVKDIIPQTPESASNAGSFDLTMTNVYGDTVNITLPPSITKTTEQVVQHLPNTGPTESLLAGIVFTVFVSYFFARSRLFAKELDIIRTDYATTGGY